MNRQERVAAAIKEVVTSMMDRVMVRVLEEDPFVKEEHHSSKPLYAALVPDEIFKGSHFERRFVTPFGKVWEKLASVVATEAHGKCIMEQTINGTIGIGRLKRIQEVLNRLEHSAKGIAKVKIDWNTELAYILKGRGQPIPVSVVCDIFVTNIETNESYAFELEEPTANRYEIKASKEKLLKLLAMEQKPQLNGVHYVLLYDYEKKDDNYWHFPKVISQTRSNTSILIGSQFWDFIGGEGTYKNIMKEINLLGKEYREEIYQTFLGIEPPFNQLIPF